MSRSQNGHQTDTLATQFLPSNPTFDEFLKWERETKDILDFKKTYVDVAGDLHAGIILSHIVYWFMPNKVGASKLEVKRNGKEWIASTSYEWWDRLRLSPKRAGRALEILEREGLIETRTYKFWGNPTTHIHLVLEVFLSRLSEVVNHPPGNRFLPKQKPRNSSNRKNDIDQRDETFSPNEETPYTETTAQTNQNIRDSHAENGAGLRGEFSSAPKRAEASEPSPFDALDEAIARTWNTNARGTIKLLRTTLLGLHPPGTVDFDNNIEPPASAEEILEFKDYYQRQFPDGKLPIAPVKIQRWIYQLRTLIWANYLCKGYQIPVKAKVPPDCKNSPRAILNYLEKYYPKERSRILYIAAVLRGAKPQKLSLISDPPYYGGEFVKGVSSRIHVSTWGDLQEYLSRLNLSQEDYAIKHQLTCIDIERAKEIEEIKCKVGQ